MNKKELTESEEIQACYKELQACCELMSRVFKKMGVNINANSIKFYLDDIIDKETKEKFGNITVIWEKGAEDDDRNY